MQNQPSEPNPARSQANLNPLDLLEELQKNVGFARFGGVSMSDIYARRDIVEQLIALQVPEAVIDAAIQLGEWEGESILESQVLAKAPPSPKTTL